MRNIKRNCFVFCLIIALFFPLCLGISFFDENKQKNQSLFFENDYNTTIKNLAESVKFSTDLKNFYEPLPENSRITIYNFLAVIRFKNETELMNTTYPSTSVTYYDMLQKMYNDEDTYSVKNYYKEVSNNKLNLQTVFVFEESSFQISRTRNTFGNKNNNDGVGYDPNGYTYGIIPTRMYLEYTLYNEICEQAISVVSSSEYQAVADYDDDNLVDSFSVVALPDQSSVVVDWGDLLWSHSVTVPYSYIENYSGILNIDTNNFKYSYTESSQTKTKYISNFMLTTMDSSVGEKGIPNNNTDIHELGHVLGFPDYYIYSSEITGTDLESETRSVNVWDIMGYNHLTYPQYPLSYNRYLQGWLNECNITEIKKNGTYTLKPVSYEKISGQALSTRTVAYKIVNPNRQTESIWFEFRLQKDGTFENNSEYLKDGLIVYRVDEGFEPASGYFGMLSAGNFAAAPYNVYVFRNDLNYGTAFFKSQFAPLNLENKTMGDGATYDLGYYKVGGVSKNIISTAQNLTWQNYEGTCQSDILSTNVNYVDSGIKIEIVSMDTQTMEISFNVEWDQFNETISRDDLHDTNLYNALLTLAGKQQTDLLEIGDFDGVERLDLSNLNISSVAGLQLFTFENLKYVDLSSNSISNITYLQTIATAHNNILILLNDNKIDISELDNSTLNSNNFIFLIQQYNYKNQEIIFDQTISFLCYVKQNDLLYFDVEFAGETVHASDTIVFSFSQAKSYTFEVAPNSSVFSSSFAKSLNIVKLKLSIDGFNIERNASLPSLLIEGMDASLFEISISPAYVDTSNVTSSSFTVSYTVVYIADTTYTKTILYSFMVVDTTAPVVTLLGEEKIEILYRQEISLPAKEIQIDDNGDLDLLYTFVQNPSSSETGIWTKKYYKASFDNLIGYVKVEQISSIDTSLCGYYIIEYEVRDGQGNTGYAQRLVIINSNLIDDTLFEDYKLYNRICELAGTSQVYETSLIEFDFVDLSSCQIEKLTGLENLMFKDNCEIDLSNNKIKDITVLDDVLQANNITKINLIFNNISYPVLNDKMIYGLQGIVNNIYLKQDYNSLTYNLTDDFSGYYDYGISTDLSYGQNVLQLGEYEISFNSTSNFNSYSTKIFYFDLEKTNSNIEVEVNTQNFSFESYFEINGVSYTSYDIKVNGTKILQDDLVSTFFNGEVTIEVFSETILICEFNLSVSVVDTTRPQLVLTGGSTLYLKKNSNYSEPGYELFDNYDAFPIVDVQGNVNTAISGKYELFYTATDSSGNVSNQVKRTVFVGDVKFNLPIKIEYNKIVEVKDYLIFEQFLLEDFNIISQNSVNTTSLGVAGLDIKLQHKQDSSLLFDLTANASIVDTTIPVINLIGGDVKIFVDSTYVEQGFTAYDNYDNDITSKVTTSTNLDTSMVGEYIIYYRVSDTSGNQANIESRKVEVIYRPITSVEVKNAGQKYSYKIGEEVVFRAEFGNFSTRLNNSLPILIWSVDGEEISRGISQTLKYTFEDKGKHELTVTVLNEQLEGEPMSVQSNVFSIQIEDIGFLDKYGVVVLIASFTTVFLVVVFAFYIRRKNRFFQ